MKYLFRKLAIVVTLLSCAFPYAFAYDFETEGLYFNVVSTADLTASVSGLADSSIVDLKIPSEVTYKSRKLLVIEIGESAFSNTMIESLSIPQSVAKIGHLAFSGDKNLTQCDLGNVECISASAFEDTGIKKLVVPNSCKTIGWGAFRGMKKLEEITLPSGLDEILGYCFFGCSNLKEISLPASVEEVCYNAFNGCSSLKELQLPENLRTLGDNVLDGCTLIKELVIPDKVTKIGFCNYANLKSITIGTGLWQLPCDVYYYSI